jgi:DNA-binding CsgD family transcriptional regulator
VAVTYGAEWAMLDADAEGRPAFIGRERERHLLGRLAAAADGGLAAAVVTGAAGIGKTALLRHVAAASTASVLWVCGVQSEASLPYAAAADVLLPYRGHFRSLPVVQRRALEAALALREGPTGGALAVCAGALGALAAAGETEPLLVVVDDFDCLDDASRQLLAFVARRLVGDHVVMLLSYRDQIGSAQPVPGLPTLPLDGLTLAECEVLTRRAGHPLPPQVLKDIVAATGGNPLAVLETVRHGGAVGTATTVGGKRRIRVGRRVRSPWLQLLAQMPESTRQALFVVAIAPASGEPAVVSVLDALGLGLEDLQPAEREGLVDVAEGIALRHPLLGQVLAEVTPLGVRAATYRALADLAGSDLRPWYLSQAAFGPDEALAVVLEDAAALIREQRGCAEAVRLAHRSAEVSADPSSRARRLIAAAADAQAVGDGATAIAWCREVLQGSPDAAVGSSATLVLARALAWSGRMDEGHDALLRGAGSIRAALPETALELLAEALLPATMGGDLHHALQPAVEAQELVASGTRVTVRAQALLGEFLLLRGDLPAGCHVLDLVSNRLQRGQPEVVGGTAGADGQTARSGAEESLAHAGRGRCWAERFDEARPMINQAVDDARRRGATVSLAFALLGRSELEIWTGQWAAAYADATEGVGITEDLRLTPLHTLGLVTLARLDAARGERTRSGERVGRALHTAAGTHSLGWIRALLPAAGGLAALTCGDPEAATEYGEAASRAVAAAGIGNPIVIPFAGDLAEAYVRCGRQQEARGIVDGLRTQATSTGLAYPAVAAARCTGLMAADLSEVRTAFAAAYREPVLRAMPFEFARTLLCEGEALRRLRRPMAARAPLREAEAIFAGFAAPAWVRRCETELAATGVWPRCHDGANTAIEALTPQEVQIAQLVASGHNNVETAAALFVSRKTVEAHLTRVYRKLRVRSRTDLARVLNQPNQPDMPD